MLHRGQTIFLQAAPLCSISLPQVGQARILGISGKFVQRLNFINLQFDRINKSFCIVQKDLFNIHFEKGLFLSDNISYITTE